MADKLWKAPFTNDDFSKSKMVERRAVFKYWRESAKAKEPELPGATSLPNISNPPGATSQTRSLPQLSPLLVRSVPLTPPSSRFRDIKSLPSQTAAQSSSSELHQPHQVASSSRPVKSRMSYFNNHQASNGIGPQDRQDSVVDPAISGGFDSNSPRSALIDQDMTDPSDNGNFCSHSNMANNSGTQGTASQTSQANTYTSAQDSLPADAVAGATYNSAVGIWVPAIEWHAIRDLDTRTLNRETLENRIRYLFDFMATPAGGRAFVERISSNIRILRAAYDNITRHVDVDQKQLDIIDDLAADEPIDHPNGGDFKVEGRPAIANKLYVDKYWQDVFGLELQLSELALTRVEVARKATVHLGDVNQGLQLGAGAIGELEDWYGQFQDMREEVAKLMVAILKRVGSGRACADMVQRHRNELWDVWNGRPTPDSVL